MPEGYGLVVAVSGEYSKSQCILNPGMICVVGRRSRSDIAVLNERVSRLHCRIEMLQEGNFRVTDESSNGTFYNNLRLERGIPYVLPPGSRINIAGSNCVLELRRGNSF